MDKEEEFQKRLINQALIKYNTAYEKSTDDSKEFVSPFQCPRCGNYMPSDCALVATSRISEGAIQIYVCGECGLDEATEYLSITEWEIAKKLNEK